MIKKIRIFAGPNGSGKTTLFERIHKFYHFNVGIYVNPDIIESAISKNEKLLFSDFKIQSTLEELIKFFSNSSLTKKAGIDPVNTFEVKDNVFILKQKSKNSYLAAILSEYIRQKLLQTNNTFSTETVMSDPSKIDLIKTAKKNGFKVYLYYITTDDVIINIERVNSRVMGGGHFVPEEKIKERYKRSLGLLFEALKYCDRAFLVDSTELPIRLIAEVSNGRMIVKQGNKPNWFIQNIINKLKINRNKSE